MGIASAITKIGLLLAIIGAVALGIVGIWQYNFIADIFGSGTQTAPWGARIVYMVIGAGGLIALPLFLSSFRRRRVRETSYVTDAERSGERQNVAPGSSALAPETQPSYTGESRYAPPISSQETAAGTSQSPGEDLGSERVDEHGRRWRRVA